MTTTRRRAYTEDFKRDAVALVTEQGYSVAEAARSLDISASLLGRWKRQQEGQVSDEALSLDEREELKHLRKENRLLRMEKDILKKASQYFAKEMKGSMDSFEIMHRAGQCSTCAACWMFRAVPATPGLTGHSGSYRQRS